MPLGMPIAMVDANVMVEATSPMTKKFKLYIKVAFGIQIGAAIPILWPKDIE
jgi:hypothetical protein